MSLPTWAREALPVLREHVIPDILTRRYSSDTQRRRTGGERHVRLHDERVCERACVHACVRVSVCVRACACVCVSVSVSARNTTVLSATYVFFFHFLYQCSVAYVQQQLILPRTGALLGKIIQDMIRSESRQLNGMKMLMYSAVRNGVVSISSTMTS